MDNAGDKQDVAETYDGIIFSLKKKEILARDTT